MSNSESLGIAIIGMAGAFSGTANLSEYWQMLREGRHAFKEYTKEEILAAGEDPKFANDPNYVSVGTYFPDIEYFDADFFGISPGDALITDPQQRYFLQFAWEALEQAGYPPTKNDARVGIYAGTGESSYLYYCLTPNWDQVASTFGEWRVMIHTAKDFIATRAAYRLNLKGPAVTVQTACSTSLVALHMACQSLLNYECDMALTGGSTLRAVQGVGYLYLPGMIASPDGYCRAFDAQAEGTTDGQGCGVVLLKRLDEALADGDTIHAVIMGTATNNDGADKVGYTAPSVIGQSDVVIEAQEAAGIHPDEISYVEAHGTGTVLGDPVEIEALTRAFRTKTNRTNYCPIGSVKSNIGHADTAAGVAGLLKTVLSLKHRQIPPSLHYTKPNPKIDFPNTPFFVNNQLCDWQIPNGARRIAGVSSFGIGGTNAHAVVAEAPLRTEQDNTRDDWRLLCLSAKTPTAAQQAVANLSHFLRDNSDLDLANVAYTLQVGRTAFAERRMVVARNVAHAVELLSDSLQISQHHLTVETLPEIVFMFPGVGSQFPNMGRDLYEHPHLPYRDVIDECCHLLQAHFDIDLKPLLFPTDTSPESLAVAAKELERTSLAMPAIFMTSYALAKVWQSWGLEPVAMIGHSLGQYVAACLAGVFSLEDAIRMVTWRGQLIERLPDGAMLSVRLSEAELEPHLFGKLAISVINRHDLCTVSGSRKEIDELAERLEASDIAYRHIPIVMASHSPMLDPILGEFGRRLQQITFSEPTIPFICNISGSWISAAEAMNPNYWVQHLRQPVHFAAGVGELLQAPNRLFVEVGPGRTLQTLLRTHADKQAHHAAFTSLPTMQDERNDYQFLLNSVGELWLHNAAIDWQALYPEEQPHRIPLPTYPFERKRYWVEPPKLSEMGTQSTAKVSQSADIFSFPAVNSSNKGDTGPISPTEQQIATIWAQSLGVADITPMTDFFAAGGDSLLATQIVSRLSSHFQVKLDSHALLQATTVARMAALIDTQIEQPAAEPLLPEVVVPIQSGDPARKPLFLLHPAGGHVYFYRALAQYLDPQLPIYGIRAQGIEGEAEALTTVPEMVEVYTAAVRQIQPHGPYDLAGSSFGGTLAYAMAHKLLAEGERVDFIGLIDTPSPGHMPAEIESLAQVLGYLLESRGQEVDLEALARMDEAAQLTYFIEQSGDEGVETAELKTTLRFFKTNIDAMRAYNHPSYPGKLHFFRARERDTFNAQSPELGWVRLAEDIEIYSVPGSHTTMNEEPHVPYLAAKFQKCLQDALGAAEGFLVN